MGKSSIIEGEKAIGTNRQDITNKSRRQLNTLRVQDNQDNVRLEPLEPGGIRLEVVRKANPSPSQTSPWSPGLKRVEKLRAAYFPKMFCDAQWHAHGVGAPAIPIITRYALQGVAGRGRLNGHGCYELMFLQEQQVRASDAVTYPGSSTPAAVRRQQYR